MRARRWSLMVLLVVIAAAVAVAGCSGPANNGETTTAAAPAAAPQELGGQDEFGPYEPVANWPQPLPDGPDGVKHDGWTWGSVGAIFAETPNRIWIAQRGELPLPPKAKPWTPYGMLQPTRGNATGNGDGLTATCESTEKRGWERRWHHSVFVVDADGKLIDEWPFMEKMFSQDKCGRGPHKIKMNPYDAEKHIWIIDDQQHLIWKFTYDGKLVMTLGTVGKRGRDGGKLFDRPTDIDWLPDGTFFISDGYGGTRVAKFDKDGKFIKDWGGPPKDPNNPGPNEFDTVHSIAITKDQRLFVVDRTHRRFQIFDTDGKFLTMFTTGVNSSPYYHFISTDQNVWVGDGGTNRILKYDLDGHFLYGWGGRGGQRGTFNGPHQITTDQDGNLYVAEVFNGRVQKFRPKPNADRSKMVGQEARYTLSTN
jgi:6-bladed beta-propeller protein/NHL repeat-containing protein